MIMHSELFLSFFKPTLLESGKTGIDSAVQSVKLCCKVRKMSFLILLPVCHRLLSMPYVK